MFRNLRSWLKRAPLDAAELAKAEIDDGDNGWRAVFAIDPDEHHARHVGRMPDGRQFFLTTPFVPATEADPGGEYVALYIFDGEGRLAEASVESFGPRAAIDEPAYRASYQRLLDGLGDVRFERIEIEPFAVAKFDTHFGLIVRPPEDDEDIWAVEAQPGNYMAFFEPWDSGDYDT